MAAARKVREKQYLGLLKKYKDCTCHAPGYVCVFVANVLIWLSFGQFGAAQGLAFSHLKVDGSGISPVNILGLTGAGTALLAVLLVELAECEVRSSKIFHESAKRGTPRVLSNIMIVWASLILCFFFAMFAAGEVGEADYAHVGRRLLGTLGVGRQLLRGPDSLSGGAGDREAGRALGSNGVDIDSNATVRPMGGAAVRPGQPFIPEILFRGRWYPICGQGFTENHNGATTICTMIGNFSSGYILPDGGYGGDEIMNRSYSDEDLLPVGVCRGDSRSLKECSGKYDKTYDEDTGHWANYTYPPWKYCSAGKRREHLQILCREAEQETEQESEQESEQETEKPATMRELEREREALCPDVDGAIFIGICGDSHCGLESCHHPERWNSVHINLEHHDKRFRYCFMDNMALTHITCKYRCGLGRAPVWTEDGRLSCIAPTYQNPTSTREIVALIQFSGIFGFIAMFTRLNNFSRFIA
eukprot:g2037.t1